MDDKNYCVYKHTFPNGKIYIGITKQLPKYRWRSDGSGYKPRKKNSSKIWNAIQKYGWDNVKHEILYDHLTKDDAEQKEVYLIALFKSDCDDFGYNIAPGGWIGECSEETRRKIGNSRRGNNYGMIGENAPFYGKRHTQETKNKISAATSGENNPYFGKHHTEETKIKVKIASLQRSKPVEQYDKNGMLVEMYASIRDASRKTSINRACIMAALNGSQKTAGGYVWKESKVSSVTIFNKIDLSPGA